MGDQRLWPYSRRAALLAAPLILLALLLTAAISKPALLNDRLFILIVVGLSLLPVALTVLDTLIQGGAVLEYKGAKLILSSTVQVSQSSISVPTNVAVPSQPVSDSGTGEILDSLRAAVDKDVAVVDLGNGREWWETRLLVLIAGAARLDRPRVIVFTATDGGMPEQFEGWGRPVDLLRQLLHADRRYQSSYARARAAANQWALIEPAVPGAPAAAGWVPTGLAQ
jgi:hypothetical protein